MRQLIPIISLLFVLACFGQNSSTHISVKKVLKLMGSRFEITIVAPNEEIAYVNIDEAVMEIKRVEKMISSWDLNSETSEINRFAGIRPVKVSPEVFALIERSKKIAEITSGAFDITYASMDKIWRFDGTMDKFPSENEVKASISKVGHEKIQLNPETSTVFLPERGMKIGFGAIGKGYAADKAKELMVKKEVLGGVINAGGDLTTWGTKETKERWTVGITNPLDKEKVFSWLPVVESSVATSGNYERFFHYEGKKYTHIIDPRSGYPTTGTRSVTVFAKKAELCDALATAVFVMGRDSGIHMVNQLDGVEVVVIDDDNKVHKSSGIIFNKTEEMN